MKEWDKKQKIFTRECLLQELLISLSGRLGKLS